MTDASTKGLKPRSLEIFQEVVAAYLEDGLPVGFSDGALDSDGIPDGLLENSRVG